ncbi:MAG TPA: PD-(D/E)XK nuclease family protein, partial [Chitinophagales bacterium]|nr:PD-(D/E)XK nuclease family protein [Chitinophagales bacterium]
TYINCPAQFYFKYIANLYELQNLDEEINNLLFGNILHRTIELLYEPYINQLITAAIIDQLLNNNRLISKKLNQAFTDNHFEHHKEGKNLLLKRVIKRLVVKVLENDKTDAPFKIVGLETREYTTTLPLTNGQEVVISGSIDRVDEVFLPDGSTAYRIIDYKTGNVKLQTPTALKKDLPDYLNAYFIQPDYKTGFQTYLYSYLFWVHHHKNIALKAGLYALKQLSGGIRYLRQGEILSAELLAEFEKQLCLLLNQIFDPNTPFTQTPLPERYTYSPYQGLVGF